MITLNLLLIALLILLTAFFVATEFAIIRIRPSRVDQLVLEGRRNSAAIEKVTSNLDGYLSACQLGITITALGLGWLGEPTVEEILYPLFSAWGLPSEASHLISFAIAFAVITFLHVVLGELAPKTLAIQKAEAITSLTARPIIIFYNIMYPFIWLLNGSANRLVRLFGLRPAKEHEEAHSEEELRIILSESYRTGNINQTEYGYVERIFAFDELLARDIMVPRTDMICLDVEHTIEKNLEIMRTEQFTRFPVVQGDKDTVVGMLNTKKYFLNQNASARQDLKQMLQPVFNVSEATPISELLKLMQKNRVHMVLLIDEYGGTSGLITIEDILEEIVGEIRDEFDGEELPEVEHLGEGHLIVDGKLSLTALSEMLHTEFEHEEDFTTIGGWLYNLNPAVRKGGKITYKDLVFHIKEKDRFRIRKVEIIRETPDSLMETAATMQLKPAQE
ncbi:hemolysin family protein [Paenibacillus sp. TRM 82003]|nr:hemolysin family protein [Paenibacillus sp. TRM 82003]